MISNLRIFTSNTDEQLHGLESPFESQRSFLFTLISTIFFFMASVLYLYLSINNLRYEEQVKDFPISVLEADDDEVWEEWGFEDDYVFVTKAAVPVSEYTIVYVSAALCFVVAGIIDLIRWRSMINVLMILAADFGAAAAVYSEVNPSASHILNLISVHLWLLEAFTVFYNRSSFGAFKGWLRLGDTCFVIGTFMDVVLSWFSVFKHAERGGLQLAQSEIAASCFWLIAATVYLATTIILRATQPIATKPSTTRTVTEDSLRDPGTGSNEPDIIFTVNTKRDTV